MTPDASPAVSASSAANPLRGAQFLLSAGKLSQLPADDEPEVAFAGRSNAGKSSALNCLCEQRALARVSRTPGRTQLINLFTVAGHGRVVDLPGYGYARAPPETRRKWEALVGRYVAARRNLRGLVVLMDVRRPLQPLDVKMLDWAQAHELPVHVLLTKADKLGRGAAADSLQRLRSELSARGDTVTATAQLFSSLKRQGVEQTVDIVLGWFGTRVP